jgi:N,N'-diacetyllegionaminate synthase
LKKSTKRSQKFPELIVEIANAHDGDSKKFESIINQIATIDYENKSIKFQIFSPNGIAEKDYEWYPVYKKITFGKKFWNNTLHQTRKAIKNIWIDVFDDFGVSVVKENIKIIHGIKLQASTLENANLYKALGKIDFSDTKLILNISGFSIKKISDLLQQFNELNFEEVILQIGFQNYPTKVEHTGLQKINVLKENFANKICIADHIDAESQSSIDIPVIGLAMGADMIEKHFCLERKNTQYDYYSSMEFKELHIIINKIIVFLKSSTGPFLQSKEKEYLEKSIQVPIINKELDMGDLISDKILSFKRTNKTGMSYQQLKNQQTKLKILKNNLPVGSTIKTSDFKKAKIGVVVAGRMKSTRLKKKALLKIANKESVKLCLESCLGIQEASKVILATSTNKDDFILSKYLPNNKKMHFFRGHPDNVIKRYVDASENNNIDVIIRVTADCPFISKEIASILLKSHFDKGADYTAAKDFCVGTSCEIINLSALKKVLCYFKDAEYSEYMTWYFQNNTKIFNTNIVALPSELIRKYRLTLDYEEDLKMFEKLIDGLGSSDLSTKNIFNFLDKNKEVSNINLDIPLTYKVDKELIKTLNTKTKVQIKK